MESLAKIEAFLTFNDDEENFDSHMPCRVINLAKSEMGKVSKKLLENVLETLSKKMESM